MKILNKALSKYHAAMNDVFSAYGSFVAKHPFIPLVCGILILGSFCLGIINAKKEIDLEKLWVERQSRVVTEKQSFDAHFGGLPRKEGATINLKSSLDAKFTNLSHAMDALAMAIKPIYDNISWTVHEDGKSFKLHENDFCERPRVPATLGPGSNPIKDGNWLSWGYQQVSECVLKSTIVQFPNCCGNVELPKGWGIDYFPCFKLTPMDCFKEGQEIDYPSALKLLEQNLMIGQSELALKDYVSIFESEFNNTCLSSLNNTLVRTYQRQGLTPEATGEILAGVKSVVSLFASWGYNWRPSYRSMSNSQILDHFRGAIAVSKNSSKDPTDPAILHCILGHQPCCMSWFGEHIPIEASFGSVEYDSSGQISEIGALRWGANHWHHNHPLWIDYITRRLETNLTEHQRKEYVLKWEKLLRDSLIPLRAHAANTTFGDGEYNSDFQLQFNVWRSSEDVLADANKTPIWQIVLSSVLVSTYAYFAFVNFKNPVHSYTWLVSMGMLIVSLAVVSGFGLTSALGIKLSPLAGSVVPFLALGLGIDDVFVLVNILRNFLEDETMRKFDDTGSNIPEREMRATLSLAGSSVVLTTFSVLASFFISSLSPMPIVQWFCWQMGITATLHTLGMVLIFMPIMAIDAKRVKSRVVDPNLWLMCGRRRKQEPKETGGSQQIVVNESEFQDNSASSIISRAVAKYYAPLFKSNIFKITVVAVFAVFLALMTYLGFWKVESGLKLSEVTLKGSYQHDFAVVTEDRFPDYDIWLVTQNIPDYSLRQHELSTVYGTMQNLSEWLPAQPSVMEGSWLGNLYVTLNQSLDQTTKTLPPLVFNQAIQPWTTSPLGVLSVHDLSCENALTKESESCFVEKANPNWKISATKTVVFARNLGAVTENNLNMMRSTRKAMDTFNKQYFNGTSVAYVYGFPFLYFEQYLHSLHDLYVVVGFALVGVFFAVLIFQFSITISFLIALVLLMVDIEVYGFLYVLGAKLNSLSLVNLGIVIGMASEFTYLARSFLMVQGTKNERVAKALEWTFEPLLHGFGTQVAATIPLLFLKYHGFRIYYFAMFTIMGIIGFLNGFVLLPVLLSWFGPPPLPHIQERVCRVRVVSLNGISSPSANATAAAPRKEQHHVTTI